MAFINIRSRIVLATVTIVISVAVRLTAAADSISTSSNEYHFHSLTPKAIDGAYIVGTSCDDLTGTIYHRARMKAGIVDSIRWLLDWKQEMEGDRRQIAELKIEPPLSKGRFFCVPYVNNPAKFLNDATASVEPHRLTLDNGLYLLYFIPHTENALPQEQGQPSSGVTLIDGHFLKVKEIRSCSPDSRIFCADISHYLFGSDTTIHNNWEERITGYTVICWSGCDKLRSSPEALQKAILFGIGTAEYGLDGGYMLSDYTRQAGELYSNDDPRMPRTVNDRFNRVVSLMEPK